MGADYSFYMKSIATYAPTFFGYIISVLAKVLYLHIRFFQDFLIAYVIQT